MPSNVGPPHDRVWLSGAERRIIAGLEDGLAEEERAAAARRARLHRTGAAVGAQVYRLAPLLLPPAFIATLLLANESPFAGAFGAMVTGGLACLVTWRLVLLAIPRLRAWRDSCPPPRPDGGRGESPRWGPSKRRW